MNRRGHLWFAAIMEILAIYILKDFIMLPYKVLLFHSAFYFVGTAYVIDYWIFDSYKLGISHHGFWHSKIFLWLLILLFIPLMIKLYLDYPKIYLFDVPFNYYSIASAVLIGVVIHIVGDSFSGRLR